MSKLPIRDGYDYSILVKPSDVKGGLSPFVRQLLTEDSRVKVFPLADEFYLKGQTSAAEMQAYVPRKDVVAIPYGLPTIEHEVAHMVEMNNFKRLIIPDWGLKLFAGENQDPNSKELFAALARETRVRAIQRRMDKSYNYTGVNLLTHPTWGSTIEKLPFGRFHNRQELATWLADTDERTYRAWDLERIKFEWNRRLDYIHHWMETKAS